MPPGRRVQAGHVQVRGRPGPAAGNAQVRGRLGDWLLAMHRFGDTLDLSSDMHGPGMVPWTC